MRVWLVCILLCLVIRSLDAKDGSSSLSSSGSMILKRSIPDDDDNSTELEESDELDDSDETTDNEAEEVGQAATIEEQVSSLRNETQTKKQTLTRLEAFFEELERRILRLEAANNGTRGVTESEQESMTSPTPVTTTNLPCCHKIKLKSRKMKQHLLLGVYNIIDTEDDVIEYRKLNGFWGFLSNSCNQTEMAAYKFEHDSRECRDPKLKILTGFTGSCFTGPKLYSALWHLYLSSVTGEFTMDSREFDIFEEDDCWPDWEKNSLDSLCWKENESILVEDDTLTIVCVD